MELNWDMGAGKMDYEALGRKIRGLRRERHMTQTELAKAIQISQPFLGHIERGSRIASLETLVKICNTLGTDPNFLLEESIRYHGKDSLTGLLKKALKLAEEK
ncbi:MAG: helix-turn-helix transcriptional regulator [Clostridiales bacterium]|nr:helix-turn-helix transcriptional regulator [Clostridiales bacterium]